MTTKEALWMALAGLLAFLPFTLYALTHPY